MFLQSFLQIPTIKQAEQQWNGTTNDIVKIFTSTWNPKMSFQLISPPKIEDEIQHSKNLIFISIEASNP